jgi:hypothetical protein
MWIIQIIGIFVSFFLFLFIFLMLIYFIFKKESDPFVAPSNMPVLRPLPIPTKNRPFVMRLLVWIFEVRQWELVNNWQFKLASGEQILIPKGFIFDGASIPRIFWAILSPVGLLLIPGLIHDYGYKYDQLWEVDDNYNISAFRVKAGRNFWDKMFKDVGNQVNGFSLVDTIAWLGVSLGGHFAWKKHRKIDVKPEKPQFLTGG